MKYSRMFPRYLCCKNNCLQLQAPGLHTRSKRNIPPGRLMSVRLNKNQIDKVRPSPNTSQPHPSLSGGEGQVREVQRQLQRDPLSRPTQRPDPAGGVLSVEHDLSGKVAPHLLLLIHLYSGERPVTAVKTAARRSRPSWGGRTAVTATSPTPATRNQWPGPSPPTCLLWLWRARSHKVNLLGSRQLRAKLGRTPLRLTARDSSVSLQENTCPDVWDWKWSVCCYILLWYLKEKRVPSIVVSEGQYKPGSCTIKTETKLPQNFKTNTLENFLW